MAHDTYGWLRDEFTLARVRLRPHPSSAQARSSVSKTPSNSSTYLQPARHYPTKNSDIATVDRYPTLLPESAKQPDAKPSTPSPSTPSPASSRQLRRVYLEFLPPPTPIWSRLLQSISLRLSGYPLLFRTGKQCPAVDKPIEPITLIAYRSPQHCPSADIH